MWNIRIIDFHLGLIHYSFVLHELAILVNFCFITQVYAASFLLAVWFCIYTHVQQLRILKFQDSVYQKERFVHRQLTSEESQNVVLFCYTDNLCFSQ